MSIVSKSLYRSMIGVGYIFEKKFINITKKGKEYNESVLFKILKKNENSEIGKKYKFKDIKSLEDFGRKFPITEYEYYEDYIKSMSKGQNNVLVNEKIEYFGHTSGTTGSQKLIPVTKSSRLVASKYMAILINRFSYNEFKENWNYGRGLIIADIVNTTYSEGGIPICSATSGGIRSIKGILKYLYTSPIEVMMIEDKESALYLHLLFGLQERGLLYISGVFISNVLDMFRVLEKHGEDLVRDIRKGSINKKVNITEDIRKKLINKLKPNASRADQLGKEIKKGYKGIAKRVWPSLTFISTVTGANFSIYDDKLDYYTDEIPVYSPVYAATEGTIGINPYVKKIEYVVIPDTCFYEFIPVNEEQSNKTLLLDELKVGEDYEIVVTNYSGLYRYRLGDVVKVKGYYNSCPSIEFLYRKKQVLNMVSEKTNEDHITNAIKNTMRYLKMSLVDYTTLPCNIVTPGRYLFYFEMKDILNKKELLLLEEVLDKELRKSNLAYDRARRGRKLDRLKIYLVKENTFNDIKEKLMCNGISKNQIKIPRVATNNEKILNILKRSKLI